MILKNHGVEREKALYGNGRVKLSKNRRPRPRNQSRQRSPEPSPVANKLKSVLHMQPSKAQTLGLRTFFENNPVKSLDEQAKAVLSSYFAIKNTREIEKRRNVLMAAVPSKTRTAVYSALRKNDLPGHEGRLVRDVADLLLARDRDAVFTF